MYKIKKSSEEIKEEIKEAQKWLDEFRKEYSIAEKKMEFNKEHILRLEMQLYTLEQELIEINLKENK